MNITESPEEAAFRHDVMETLDRAIAPSLRNSADFASRLECDRRLAAVGYLGHAWPRVFGGKDGTPVMSLILDEQRARIGIPASRSPSRFGVNLLGPALMAHGTLEQQQELLPPIRRAETVWCQCFSEPEAGSDLANVRTRLSSGGDHYVINGSKVWTTQAHEADWAFALVRSGANEVKHQNLAFVLVDMKQPGILIRPLVQATGDMDFSEVFFDDAVVEPRHIVGEIGSGWAVAQTVLGAERSYGQLSRYFDYIAQADRITAMQRLLPVAERKDWQPVIGEIYADLDGIRGMSYRIASLATAGDDLGAMASISKLWWSSAHQRLARVGHDLAMTTDMDVDFWTRLYLESRAETIYAGSSQIQRNIVSERQLGLPRG